MAELPVPPRFPRDAWPPREIAIVMLSALGDAVHVLPVVNALKRSLPKCRITWAVQPAAHRLVSGHPSVDDFIVFHRRRGLAGLSAFADFRRRVRGRHFDLLLALQVYFKAGVLAKLLDARVKLGFDRARARDLNWLFTTHRIQPRPHQHVQDQYLEFVRHLGIAPEPIEWKLRLTATEAEEQEAFFAGLGAPACAVVVGTSKSHKNWAPERYARLIEVLEARLGLRSVLVGGPSAVERAAADAILARTTARPVDALGDGIRRMVWLLQGSAVVVSPDTGPLHVANALGRPVVGLYGYTNPKRYGPYGPSSALVVDGYARSPDEDYPPVPEYRADGMARVDVDSVVASVQRALSNPELFRAAG